MRTLVLLAVLVAACSPPRTEPASSPPAESDSPVVRLTCDTGQVDAPCAFVPSELTVRVGATVRWVSDDDTFHTVTSTDALRPRLPNGVFDTVVDGPGERFSHTFGATGTVHYYCKPHAEFMMGTVRVLP